MIRRDGVQTEIDGKRNVVIYTGEHFDGQFKIKNGQPINKRTGLAVEIQKFPDVEQSNNLNGRILKARQTYHARIIIRFSEY